MHEAVISDKALWARAELGAELLVEGVFSGGIYLSFPEGTMLMLHDSRFGSLPFGAAVKELNGRGRLLGIEAGMTARLSADALVIPAAKIRFPICFLPAPTPSGIIAEGFLEQAAPCAAMPEDLFSRTAAPALEKLNQGLKTGDEAALNTAVQGLVGLGRGLTPSYDDYLTGLLFCLHYAGRPIAALDRAVLGSLERTNRYSAAFLRAAAEGGYFSLLADCLASGSGEALQELFAVGSSSGRDMLAGMCHAVSFLSSCKLA